jgi:hypothetical protein
MAESVTRKDARRYEIGVRPGMSEGQYLGMMLRCWGPGAGVVANGEPHYFTRRGDCEEAGERWVEEGKR